MKESRGFTLVELLIVIAIVGVLSTVGVPTFRKMIQRARQVEAKTNLSGLYKAQAAFFAEHGTYFTNLSATGYSPEGITVSTTGPAVIMGYSGLRYSVGFIRGPNCLPLAGFFHPNPIGTPFGAWFRQQNPGFYRGGAVVYLRQTGAANFGWCPDATLVTDAQGRVTGFSSIASGVISPSVVEGGTPFTTSTTASDYDVWVMDNNRQLAHTQDGVK